MATSCRHQTNKQTHKQTTPADTIVQFSINPHQFLFTATPNGTAVSLIPLTAVIMLGKSRDTEHIAHVAITCLALGFCVTGGFYPITDG